MYSSDLAHLALVVDLAPFLIDDHRVVHVFLAHQIVEYFAVLLQNIAQAVVRLHHRLRGGRALGDRRHLLHHLRHALVRKPLLLSKPEMVEELRKEVSVQRIQQMSWESSMTVVGIGSMSDDATIIKHGILHHEDFLLLTLQGAVGDILSHFIDKDGNPIESTLDNRLLSTPLEDLKRMNNVIGVAGGLDKVDAIRAVLNGHYLDVLITDEETATVLLHPHDQT